MCDPKLFILRTFGVKPALAGLKEESTYAQGTPTGHQDKMDMVL